MNENELSTDKLAVVTGFFETGEPIITFDGEDSASDMIFGMIRGITLNVGDRVLMKKFSDTYIIMGAIDFILSPFVMPEDLTGRTLTLSQGANVSGSLTVGGNLNANQNVTIAGTTTLTGLKVKSTLTVQNLVVTGSVKFFNGNPITSPISLPDILPATTTVSSYLRGISPNQYVTSTAVTSVSSSNLLNGLKNSGLFS